MNETEKQIYDKIELFINSLGLDQKNYNLIYHNNGSKKSYYSEIEVEFWKGGDVIDVYAIIIYIDGNLQATKEELIDYSLKDLEDILKSKF